MLLEEVIGAGQGMTTLSLDQADVVSIAVKTLLQRFPTLDVLLSNVEKVSLEAWEASSEIWS